MGNFPTKRNRYLRDEEKFTKPTGLYKNCLWSDKVVRRLILEGTIAPRYPGSENRATQTQECPICLMYYPSGLNVSTCCKQLICTECLLQIKPPKKHVACPFCTKSKFKARYLGKPITDLQEIQDQKEVQSVEEKKEITLKTDIRKSAVKPTVATTQDRTRLHEESMRQSREVAREQAERRRRESTDTRSNWYSPGIPSSEIEEMMILEAIRRSMLPAENERDISSSQSSSTSISKNREEDIYLVLE